MRAPGGAADAPAAHGAAPGARAGGPTPPSPGGRWSWPEGLAWGALLLVALALAAAYWGDTYDDAFITYRYAERWADTGRLDYDDGSPPVYGTTAPGYALLLGLLARLSDGWGPGVAGWGTLLGFAAALVPGWELRRHLAAAPPGARRWVPPLASLAFLTCRWTVEMAGGETLPVLALVAVGMGRLFRGRQVGAGLLLGLAVVLRPDAALAVGAAAAAQLVDHRRVPWRLLAAAAAPAAAHAAFLLAWFGRLLPGTLAAKAGETVWAAGYGAAEGAWLVRTLGPAGTAALAVLAAAGMAAGGARWLRRPAARAAVAWVLALELAYRLLGVPFAPWYHVATVALLTALAAAGAWWVAHLVARRIPGAERGGGVLEAALAVALLLPVVAPSLLYLARQGTAPPDPRQPLYQAVGTWLAHHSAPGDAVAAVEIGALGYASRRPVLDLMGLVSPRALAARAAGSLGDLVAAEKPRFLVDVPRLRPLGLGEVLAHPGVRGAYRLRATFRHPPFGGPPVRLLERAPAPSNAPFHGVQRRVPPAVPKTAGPG